MVTVTFDGALELGMAASTLASEQLAAIQVEVVQDCDQADVVSNKKHPI